jgi:methyl coenzyme M reductase alpha subunit
MIRDPTRIWDLNPAHLIRIQLQVEHSARRAAFCIRALIVVACAEAAFILGLFAYLGMLPK